MQQSDLTPDHEEPNMRDWIYIDGSNGWSRMDRHRYAAAGTQLSEAVDACHAARRRQGGRRLPDSHEAVQQMIAAGEALRAVERDAEPWTWPDDRRLSKIPGSRSPHVQ
jgi:hypothetical protein